MCMLSYYPPKIQPDIDALYNGGWTNTDGYGYAIVVPATAHRPARLIVKHGLDIHKMIQSFSADRQKYSTGPALFHSRWGTSGNNTTFNCHPFTIGGDPNTIIAHNGILPADMQPTAKDPRCDTHYAADDLLTQRYGSPRKAKSRQRIADAIGKYNKLVILTVNPRYSAHAYIINEDSGNWDDTQIWYSNYDYLPSPKTTASYHDPVTKDCQACFTKGSVDLPSAVCTFCDACQECLDDIHDCLCYAPQPQSTTTDYQYGGRQLTYDPDTDSYHYSDGGEYTDDRYIDDYNYWMNTKETA